MRSFLQFPSHFPSVSFPRGNEKKIRTKHVGRCKEPLRSRSYSSISYFLQHFPKKTKHSIFLFCQSFPLETKHSIFTFCLSSPIKQAFHPRLSFQPWYRFSSFPFCRVALSVIVWFPFRKIVPLSKTPIDHFHDCLIERCKIHGNIMEVHFFMFSFLNCLQCDDTYLFHSVDQHCACDVPVNKTINLKNLTLR